MEKSFFKMSKYNDLKGKMDQFEKTVQSVSDNLNLDNLAVALQRGYILIRRRNSVFGNS